jgi:hypothetical protein
MSSNIMANRGASLKPGTFVIALNPRGGIILVQGNVTVPISFTLHVSNAHLYCSAHYVHEKRC